MSSGQFLVSESHASMCSPEAFTKRHIPDVYVVAVDPLIQLCVMPCNKMRGQPIKSEKWLLVRAVTGRVPFTWQRFMDALLALRPSFRTVSLIRASFYVQSILARPWSTFSCQVGRLTASIRMETPLFTSLPVMVTSCSSTLWSPAEPTAPGLCALLSIAVTFRCHRY